MFTTLNDDLDLLKETTTGDESEEYGYDIETKAQSSQWKRPNPKKTRQVRSNVKVLLTVYFGFCTMITH